MIISKTPLRISFVGGGSDLAEYYKYSNGKVIGTTIDKYIYVIVKERFDDDIYVSWSQKKEIVNNVDLLEHDLVRESLKKVGINKGLEITMLADIPSTGSGLGSSSSLTVGLLNAFYGFIGKQVTSCVLAKEACEIEIDILNKPIGKQDQYNAAYGGLNCFIFNKNNTVDINRMELTSNDRLVLGSNLILHYTGITRDANLILKEQAANTASNVDDIDKMVTYCNLLQSDIKEKLYDNIGNYLKESWKLKKKLALKITNESIEKMVNIALANGSKGCKILGAGGGGFLLNYVLREDQNKFRKAMTCYKELPFMLDQFGSRIIFNMN